jgi:hypothetical protein
VLLSLPPRAFQFPSGNIRSTCTKNKKRTRTRRAKK